MQPDRQESLHERGLLSSNSLLTVIVSGGLLVIARFENSFLFLPISCQGSYHRVNGYDDVCVLAQLLHDGLNGWSVLVEMMASIGECFSASIDVDRQRRFSVVKPSF